MITECIPTRGRPERFAEMYESAKATARGEVEFIAVVDHDDETVGDYPEGPTYLTAPEGTLQSDMWNIAWRAGHGDIAHLGADDLMFRTPGWDTKIAHAFRLWRDRIGMVYCVTPETPILKADLSYVQAGKLGLGDELFAFDEERVDGKRGLKVALVTNTTRSVQELVRVETSDGTVVVSQDHPFLVTMKRNLRKSVPFQTVGSFNWIKAADLKADSHAIVSLGSPWEREETHEAGWLAGMFDGEGSVRRGGGFEIAQNPGPVLDRIEAELLARGVEFARVADPHGTAHLIPLGGLVEWLRLLGILRPERLIGKREWARRVSLKGFAKADVISVEACGSGEVVELATTTHTFVAAGLFSHNCNDLHPVRWNHGPFFAQKASDAIGTPPGFVFSANPFCSREWIDAAGFFTPPYYASWEADTWIYQLAEGISRGRYIGDVVVEHMHPMANKAPMDATYKRGAWGNKKLRREGFQRTNSPEMKEVRAEQIRKLTEAIQASRGRVPVQEPA